MAGRPVGSYRAQVGLVVLGAGWIALGGAPAAAEPLRAEQIPPALRPWVDWVLRGVQEQRCPQLPGDDSPRCAWAGALDLALEADGGRFAQTWEVHADSAVPLPGDRDRWPLGVLLAGRPAAVIERDGRPFVQLPAGRHGLSGAFAWKRLPESLPVPPATGLVALRLARQPVEFPRLAGGELFLQATTRPETVADRLDITVHRKLSDDVPLRLETRLQLAVAGKMREVVLGRALPAGFVPHALHSDLPARVEADGRLRVQLRPGTFVVTLEARQPVAAGTFTRPAPDGPWAEGDEVWVWQAQPQLRVVTVAGAPPVDPRQTTLPAPWRALPAYMMKAGASLTLQERQRGDADPAPDQLRLERQLWLDFDGRGFTARDEIRGRLGRSWRLEMGPDALLGRAAVAGVDQLITRRPDGAGAGVELRQVQVAVQADSRLEGARRRISTVGWAHDFQAVTATLNLPSGWRLLHVSGADRADTTWVKRWTLLDLFLLLLVAISVSRLYGRGPGLLALVMLVLVMQEAGAPGWIWLAVVLGEALVRALPAGQLRRLAKLYRLGAALVLLLSIVPFAVSQVRQALHPGLAHPAPDGSTRYVRHSQSLLDEAVPPPPAAGYAGAEPQEEKKQEQEQEQAKADSPAERRARTLESVVRETSVSSLGALGIARGGGQAPGRRPAAPAARLAGYDPDAQVQTGPGVPRWELTQVQLAWNGPVEQSARLTLWLEPPWAASLRSLLGVTLVVVLALLLFRSALANPGAPLGRWLPGLPLTLLFALAGLTALTALPTRAAAQPSADFPPRELLDELRKGLLERPACEPTCVTLGRLLVEATPQRLRLRLEASAAAAAPAPLPGLHEHWLPATVLLDGQPASALLRHEGRLWLRLPPGSHQVVLEGPLAGRQTVQIPFGAARPHAVAATLNGWTLAGVAEDGAVGESLVLTRAETAAARAGAAESFQAQSLPPFVTVERTLQLALDWEVHTRVVRATPPGAAVVLEVPLLPGESVVSEAARVRDGKVQVNMGPDEAATGWRSVLAQKSPIVLTAPAAGPWAERWSLDLGPIWHAQTSGIPPVHAKETGGPRLRTWRPWPGETVSIAVSRPAGVGGRTFTIDRSSFVLRPGSRSSEATLTLVIRSSRGGEHALTLPAGATLEALQADGQDLPLRLDGRKVTLPLAPGTQVFRVVFRSEPALRIFYRTPAVDLGVPSVNAELEVAMATDRWLLLLGGPTRGPVVLVWSALLVIIAAGLLLGRVRLTPLRPRHWILLGLGFVPLSLGAAAVVVGYFLALGWRRDRLRTPRAWLHDLVLVALCLWTIAAVVVLLMAVKSGLLAHPDMDIVGNLGSGSQLRWYSDRAAGPLPTAWVLSLPLLAYHVAMLAWALWLAAALIRWSRWVWSCFAEGGLWRPLRKPRAEPTPPPPAGS
jgi:hypothetical protein